MQELKPCPWCNGKARISMRQVKFLGQNDLGWKLIRYAAYGMCNRCKATGPHIYRDVRYDCGALQRDDYNALEMQAAAFWDNMTAEELTQFYGRADNGGDDT